MTGETSSGAFHCPPRTQSGGFSTRLLPNPESRPMPRHVTAKQDAAEVEHRQRNGHQNHADTDRRVGDRIIAPMKMARTATRHAER